MGNDEVVVGDDVVVIVVVGDELGDIVKKYDLLLEIKPVGDDVGDELGDIVKKCDLLLEIKPVGDGVNGSLKSKSIGPSKSKSIEYDPSKSKSIEYDPSFKPSKTKLSSRDSSSYPFTLLLAKSPNNAKKIDLNNILL